jgi:hypothetical protein
MSASAGDGRPTAAAGRPRRRALRDWRRRSEVPAPPRLQGWPVGVSIRHALVPYASRDHGGTVAASIELRLCR